MRQFLRSRSRLRLLELTKVFTDPKFVFAQPGKELQHGWIGIPMEKASLMPRCLKEATRLVDFYIANDTASVDSEESC
ncbi:hypothetical protein BGZ95_000697 [Linnemannia exigua]|uniref:Uncharacterized protein n=1 Tax=Linnemannia exigua TaxID=604196 RepID=A0AAD4HB02_9FUNG|nr:hypothetical protein BGZ95_000697 [Linnemannia exigua]